MPYSKQVDVFVGLDHHQASVQVCILDASGGVRANRKVDNDAASIAAVCSDPHWRVKAVALEACTGAADLADALVESTDWPVHLAHAFYVSKLKGSPDKSDYGDARLLADLARVGYLPRVWHAPAWVRELRRLVRFRQQQVNARRSEKLRITALLRDHRLRPARGVRSWTVAWRGWLREEVMPGLPAGSAWILEQHLLQIACLSAQIEKADEALHRHADDDAMTQRLLAEPGVGPVTAWVFRAEVGSVERFASGKSLSRFCGLTPRNASSGQRQADGGQIQAGNRLLKATLIELAHRLTRGTSRWSQLKAKMKRSGKSGSLIAVAIANRWTRDLYYRLMAESRQREKSQACAAPAAPAAEHPAVKPPSAKQSSVKTTSEEQASKKKKEYSSKHSTGAPTPAGARRANERYVDEVTPASA